ncbi:phosphoribosylamine--glycine ligase [Aestuariispira insulae]|uniref:Phosphoribosylamine--glycine ligase n=1 Tax=Aestuariispira insulae TaxID=1461337 RepID=A0A3D9HYK1_9PROT|nr:phosphoribosylamine--glycine ligase [Aestuariispira insulae]RED53986.1 phosphoribosylamine--glycine ligase [Aestuariispira insulae]
MKILVVGSGGREHALCWAIAKSDQCEQLFCAPGNAGIRDVAECVAIKAEDVEGIVQFSMDQSIDLVVIGPEAPLVLGLADKLDAVGIKSFGPSAAAAELEGSKGFMKDILAKYEIPTAEYQRFTDVEAARAYVKEKGAPIVVKTDGLAAGKGVTVAQSLEEALKAVDDAMVGGTFGDAGAEVVIEECMVGEELSFFAICDGMTARAFGSAQDHKAVFDGDKGPNTGGMGAYSPAPVCTPEIEAQIMETIITPLMIGMANEGKPYKGVLFAGLMITVQGPKVIEFNVRFGDPECQVLMMRLGNDILALLDASASGALDQARPAWKDETALTVVMAADGYPGAYEKNTVIRNLDAAQADEAVTIFHAGTALGENGDLLATGGRVLNVTARADSVTDAQAKAYEAVNKVNWPHGYFRTDIGWRAVGREKAEN